jgi:hypothetical protein
MYNQHIVGACVAQGIKVIAVTDHYRVKTAATLMEAARETGIVVFAAPLRRQRSGGEPRCRPDRLPLIRKKPFDS